MTLPVLSGPTGDWQQDLGVDFTTLTQAELEAQFWQGWYNNDWTSDSSGGGDAPNNLNWFKPQNVQLKSDGLHLVTQIETNPVYPTAIASAGMIHTAGKYSWNYPCCHQYKFDNSAGAGTWPAFWWLAVANSLGGKGGWPPEGDNLEYSGMQGHTHGPLASQSALIYSVSAESGQHILTVEWNQLQVAAWIDGEPVGSIPIPTGFWILPPYYLLLNSGVTAKETAAPTDLIVASLQTFIPGSTPPPAQTTYSGTLSGTDGSSIAINKAILTPA